jgi:hypothetical protein
MSRFTEKIKQVTHGFLMFSQLKEFLLFNNNNKVLVQNFLGLVKRAFIATNK